MSSCETVQSFTAPGTVRLREGAPERRIGFTNPLGISSVWWVQDSEKQGKWAFENFGPHQILYSKNIWRLHFMQSGGFLKGRGHGPLSDPPLMPPPLILCKKTSWTPLPFFTDKLIDPRIKELTEDF